MSCTFLNGRAGAGFCGSASMAKDGVARHGSGLRALQAAATHDAARIPLTPVKAQLCRNGFDAPVNLSHASSRNATPDEIARTIQPPVESWLITWLDSSARAQTSATANYSAPSAAMGAKIIARVPPWQTLLNWKEVRAQGAGTSECNLRMTTRLGNSGLFYTMDIWRNGLEDLYFERSNQFWAIFEISLPAWRVTGVPPKIGLHDPTLLPPCKGGVTIKIGGGDAIFAHQ